MTEPLHEHDDGGTDDALDAMLRSHLAEALGPHVGTARGRFDRFAAPPPVRRRWWPAATVGGAIAAAAAVVLSRPAPPASPPVASPVVVAATAVPVRRAAAWQTIDQGVVRLGDGSPARRLLQRRVDQLRYFDPARHATVEVAVPREQTVYVELAKY